MIYGVDRGFATWYNGLPYFVKLVLYRLQTNTIAGQIPMFISEEEAQARLRNTNNLLHRLGRTSIPEPSPAASQPGPKEQEEEEATLEDVEELEKIRKATSAASTPEMREELFKRRLEKEPGRRGGRFTGTNNIPPIFQELIGTAARVKSARYAGEMFGHNLVHSHFLSKGRHHNAGKVDQDLVGRIEQNTLKIRDQVLGVLSSAVAGITPDSLENKDPKELSIIAKNLSSILGATKPPADFGDKNVNAQVVVFSPEQDKTPDSYETVEVN